MRRLQLVAGLAGVALLAVGCGGNQMAGGALGGPGGASVTVEPDAGPTTGTGGAAPSAPDAGTPSVPDAGTTPMTAGCPDVLGQDSLPTFAVEISSDEWSKITAEFLDTTIQSVNANIYHPIVFRYGGEVHSDASIRLKGQSSRVLSATMSGANGKMQFVVAFDESNPAGSFHGLGKLVFDMPYNDVSFLHERLSNNWFRSVGIAAPCTASGRLEVNGSYYGLYAIEESTGHRLMKEFFPDNPDGDLLKGGELQETNNGIINKPRFDAFWGATTYASMSAPGIIDIDASLDDWAVEALINDGDGYYGGSHNFYIYDQGPKGWVWLPHDVDATFDWLGRFNVHPIYWWVGVFAAQPPGVHYLAVMNDPAGRARYVDALDRQLGRWDVAKLQSWIDAWSAQIADAVAADPHKAVSASDFAGAVATARRGVVERADLIKRFISCERGGDGADADGDGVRWCDDCRDDAASIHPGAPEICGNQIDDNCNGVIDEGCP